MVYILYIYDHFIRTGYRFLKAYPALQISTYNIPVGHKVYSLCNGNLFSYNTEDTEVYVFDRLNGLHDTKIQFIRYSNASQKLILVYENGNIDLIYPTMRWST